MGTDKIPPEEITDESPLFRARGRKVKRLGTRQSSETIRSLFERAGLRNRSGNTDRRKRYEIRVHSIRKFFRTNLTALGVPTEFVEHFLGHKPSTYFDIQSKGIDFLRQVYASANLRIRPEKRAGLADVLKEIIRARGEDPKRYLKAEIMPGRTVLSEEDEAEAYARGLWELLRKEVMTDLSAGPEPT